MESSGSNAAAVAENDKHLKAVGDHIAKNGSTDGFTPPGEAPAETPAAAGEAEQPVTHEGADLPGEGDGEAAEPAGPTLPPIELEGTGEQLTLKITGAAPDKGTAKLQGGKMDIPKGEYQLGDVVEAVVRMRCTEIGVVDKMNNSTGAVNERERVHKFKVMGIEKIATK